MSIKRTSAIYEQPFILGCGEAPRTTATRSSTSQLLAARHAVIARKALAFVRPPVSNETTGSGYPCTSLSIRVLISEAFPDGDAHSDRLAPSRTADLVARETCHERS